jgi:hypothetical protein
MGGAEQEEAKEQSSKEWEKQSRGDAENGSSREWEEQSIGEEDKEAVDKGRSRAGEEQRAEEVE